MLWAIAAVLVLVAFGMWVVTLSIYILSGQAETDQRLRSVTR